MGWRWPTKQAAGSNPPATKRLTPAERTKAPLSAAVDQVKAVDRARAEEQRRTTAQTEIANAAKENAETARADARAAGDAAADRLRQRVDHQLLAASQAAKDSGVAACVAGEACERAYDSLMLEKSHIR